jgi:hypothetical protein
MPGQVRQQMEEFTETQAAIDAIDNAIGDETNGERQRYTPGLDDGVGG